MKLTKRKYRKAANAMVAPVAHELHPPWAKSTQAVQYTRNPRGAWVEMWVWVPESFAIMHASMKEMS